MNDIEDIKEDKERINKSCKDKSPYKAAYEADNSIINIVMAVDGIGSIFSAPKNAFKAGEALIGGIKVVGASEAVIDMTKISGIALEGVGSAALSIAGALEAGAGIYNMSGGNDNKNVNTQPELLDWKEFQHANKGRFKTDEDGLAKDKMVDAWEQYKKEHYPNQGEHYLHRPNIRKGTKDNIKYEYKKIIDENTGEKLKVKVDPNTNKILKEVESDVGHTSGHE